MDGRNCTGRKISLLNESSDASAFPPTKIQLPPLSSHSRASSCSSSPSLSPQTPQLVRSSSSDSRAFQTPSPLTPSFAPFPSAQLPSINDNNATAHALQHPPQKLGSLSLQHPQPAAQHFYAFHAHQQHPSAVKMDESQAGSLYPPIPDVANVQATAYPPLSQCVQPNNLVPLSIPPPPAQTHRPSNSPSSEPSRVSTVSAASNSKPQPKKNQYPCPLAKQVGCNDFFTTSGHAARHAKKHTGKKDAFCPECNKAFTRKDNMEQHRRTHQNGRGAARTVASDDSKVKKTTKAPARKVSTKVESQQLEAAVQQELAEQQAALANHTTQGQPIVPHALPPMQGLGAGMIIPPSASGPYYLGPSIDPGPIPSLPMAIQDMSRPTLQRNSYTNNLEYVAPSAPVLGEDAMHYSYPSPGLSNGLNSLALAASEHRRLSEEKTVPSRSPSQETP